MVATSADGLTLGLVLLAAFLHASWNALAKASGDRLVNVTVVAATGGALSIPLIVALPFPEATTWKWLGASAVIHYVYQLSLVRTYQLGDLSQVYPIARGLAPLGVAALAAWGADERLAPGQLAGLALASAAIVSLGTTRTPDPRRARGAIGMAVVTAVLIGAYTFSDGSGVRTVPRPEIFIGWSFLLGSIPLVVTTLLLRGRSIVPALRRDGLYAVGGGLMATVGYGIALWAMSRAPMASIASLREASVLFAALMGTRLLGESFGLRRVVSAALLVVGLVLVQIRFL